jgi:hypothetical protein
MNTKDFNVKVFSPPVSELLKKELGIEKGSGIQGKMQVANASIEQIISIAKQKMQNLLARDLKAAVKSVLGTCTSLGILIENKSPLEIAQEVDQGKYDKEIQEEKTETSPEKKAELEKYFQEIHGKQEKLIEAEEAAKAAEAEAAAVPAEPAVPGAEPGAAPAPGAPAPKPEEAKAEKPAGTNNK